MMYLAKCSNICYHGNKKVWTITDRSIVYHKTKNYFYITLKFLI